MQVPELKSELHQLIDKIDNPDLLKALKEILSQQHENYDWADKLDSAIVEEIKESIQQAKKGAVIDHSSVMKQFKERYSK